MNNMLRGHAIGGSRRLNGHWQSGGGNRLWIQARTAGYLRGDETGLGGVMFGGNFGRYQRRTRTGLTIAVTTDQLQLQQITNKSSNNFRWTADYYDYNRPKPEATTWLKITIKPDVGYNTHIYLYRGRIVDHAVWDEEEDEWVYTYRECVITPSDYISLLTSTTKNNDGGSIFFGTELCTQMIIDNSVPITAWPNTWIGAPAEKWLTDLNQEIVLYAMIDYRNQTNPIDTTSIQAIIPEFAEIQDINNDVEQPFLNTTITVEDTTWSYVQDHARWII